MKKTFHMGLFCNFMNPLILERKFSQSEMSVYLTCISFWKFNDDLKACLEVIGLPSQPGNVKFSLKMQFFTFLTPWKICFMAINSELLGICSWNFWNLLFSMRLSNGEYFKDFKIFNLTWVWCIWLKWPENRLANHIDSIFRRFSEDFQTFREISPSLCHQSVP